MPKVLELYRKIGPNVQFIVIGDKKTPHVDVAAFVGGLGNALYYSVKTQENLGYKCSEIIGWNKIMRRNIGILEALRFGAEIIISIDDDNIPLSNNYFEQFERTLSDPFNGVMASSKTGWFNIGEFLIPPVYHRGFPFEQRSQEPSKLTPVVGAKIGVSAGLWLGDPDVDTVNRITNSPKVVGISDVVRNGIIVQHGCFAPFDSQNTAYVRELAPLMMLLVGVGRYDDIFASYIAERIMAETDYRLHYGLPLVYQERNQQSQWVNLQDEMYGMQNVSEVCNDLRNAEVGNGTVLDKLHMLYEHLVTCKHLPQVALDLGKAWCEDVGKAL
jgi:hypothetical protein